MLSLCAVSPYCFAGNRHIAERIYTLHSGKGGSFNNPVTERVSWKLEPVHRRIKHAVLNLIMCTMCFVQLPTVAAVALSDCEQISTYYTGLGTLEGEMLKNRLHDIIDGHHSITYAQVWDALKILDSADPEKPVVSTDVIDIYSLGRIPKDLAGKINGWNREHLWPRSYGLVQGHTEFSDLHNLRPADINVNSSRGNKYFGDCSMRPTDKCMMPANKEAAPDTATDRKTWRPPTMVRGDIARAIMYMAVRYGSGQLPALKLSDTPSVENAEMGLLSVLLQWNDLDPPSSEEQLRNTRVCSLYQHNRNPFVDHPEFAGLIWSNVPVNNSVHAWINELHYDNKGKDQNEFIEVIVGPNANPAFLSVLFYNGENGQVYSSVSLDNKKLSTNVRQLSNGYSVYSVILPSGSFQNGPADGVALVNEEDGKQSKVIQFLSYEGTVKAKGGPAKGLQSIEISVHEDASSSMEGSIGLYGVGSQYEEFEWTKFLSATPGSINVGQTLVTP